MERDERDERWRDMEMRDMERWREMEIDREMREMERDEMERDGEI